MHLLYRSNNFSKAQWKFSCMSVSMTFITTSFISSIVSWRQPLSLGNNQKSREQGLDYREAEKLCWCPSWSNSLWQRWSCGLVHCPGRNATEPIWIVLASSQGISSWAPLNPQHSNPNPNPLANQLWCIDFLTPPTPFITPHRLPAFLESLMPLKNRCSIYERWSKSSLKHSIRFCGMFSKFKQNFIAYRSSRVSDCIFEIPQLWQSEIVGCIPIPTVAIHLKLKS